MSLIIKVNAKYHIFIISMKLAAIYIRPRIPKIEIAKVTTILAYIAVMSVLLRLDS